MLKRSDDGSVRASVMEGRDLAGLDPASWDHLASHALVDNPFYARQYLLAGLETIDRNRGVRALLLHDRSGRLVGLFPFRTPFGPFLARSAGNLYQFDGTPLIDLDHAEAAVNGLLRAMGDGTMPRIAILGHVYLDSTLVALIDALAPAHGMTRLATNPYPRAFLTHRHGSFDRHAEAVLSRNRLKDIKRTLRRLQEMGDLRLEQVTEPEAVRARVEDFLALENSGWKGQGGTSFAAAGADAEFARLAFGGKAGREGLTQVDTLLLDGKPIASNISIRSGATAFTPKIAYDEALRKLSPGLARDYLIIEAFYAQNDTLAIDSAATNDHSVLLGLWDSQRQIGTLVLGPDDWRTRLVARVTVEFQRLKQWAKKLLKRG